MKPRSDSIIDDILEECPEAVIAFLERGMACPGCAFAPFCTIADAARHYDLNLDRFLAELNRATAQSAS